jgi:hypothetical protein
MAVPTYRDLQAPTLLDTTPLDTGNSQVAASLARVFKEFEGVALEPAAQLRAEQGRQQGEAAGRNGEPNFRTGLRSLTAYGAAYNNAALRSYAIQAEGDAAAQAARLEVDAQNDPERFLATFGAIRDETIKNAPPMARAALGEIYNRHLNAGVTRLQQAQAIELNKQARADVAEGIERAVENIANLYASTDPNDFALVEEEEAKLRLLLDGARGDRTITDVEWAALNDKTQRQIVAKTVVARFRQELESPYGNPVDFIERVKKENIKSEALSPSEEAELVDQLISELQQYNALHSAELRQDSALMKQRYEEGDREATAKLLAGELTVPQLRAMVQQQRLDPARATTLANMLESGGVEVDDPQIAFHTRVNLLRYTDDEIEGISALTWKTRADLILQKREMEKTWKSTQTAREAESRIERALGILPGTQLSLLTDEQRDALDRAKTEWYDDVDRLPPAERELGAIPAAEEIIRRYELRNKNAEAQQWASAKEMYISRMRAQQGDPATYKGKAKAKYEEKLAYYDQKIADARAGAVRK